MIDNWDSYQQWVSETIKVDKTYYYRGQQNSSWKLQTSFHRYSEKLQITMPDYLDKIIPDVSYYVSATQNEEIDLSNEIQFGAMLGKLQHHGFPTPLLDWTLSPYIAAYFAFKDVDPHISSSEKVSIYIFDIMLWSESAPQSLNLRDEIPFVSAFRPLAKNNPRMIQQMAATTATNISDLTTYLLNSGQKSNKVYLYKVDLPASERKHVMNELNLMGINSMTMFPDFDGICSSMKEMYFNNLNQKPIPPPPPPIKL